MPRYLYITADLRRGGSFDTDLLSPTTERHRIALTPARLGELQREGIAAEASRLQVDGVVLQLVAGLPSPRQLRVAGAVLGSGRRCWLHWPAEGAVECVDRDRLDTLRRHRLAVAILRRGGQPVYRGWISLTRLRPALLWAIRGYFPVRVHERLDRLRELYERAIPIPFAGLSPGESSGVGLYLRTDYWNRITSGGSYGHTCYVAKELKRATGDLVCVMAQRYELLDAMQVRQVVMDPPPRAECEDALVTATDHYYAIVKTACDVLRPAYIYERLCLGNYSGAMVSRDLRIPYIVEYNGSELSIQRSFDHGGTLMYHDLYLAAEAYAFRQASVISVVSEIVKQDLVRRGVKAQKIVVIPNGADPDVYKPDRAARAAVRHQIGYSDEDRVVGFTATFGGWHGVDVLAAAIPAICEASPAAKFLLIGDGAHRQIVEDAVAKYRLESRVHLVGRVPQSEGARLLSACDIFVAPHNTHMADSRFFGSPTKVFEYMAIGGGIVASDLEQMGHVLTPAFRAGDLRREGITVNDERSILCTPGDVGEFVDAVRMMVERPGLCAALGRNAREAVVREYSWKRHVEKLMAFTAGQRDGGQRDASQRGTTLNAPARTYKDEAQNQWNNNPVGAGRVKHAQPHSLAWFLEIESDRYGTYAPWMPTVMEFASHAGQDVLEIGGGLGIDLAQFASHGARVTDVDLSRGHLNLAEEHFRLRGLDGSFVHHDGEALPFPDASFDVVYSNGVIHHTPNTVAIVNEMFRVLRPWGRVIAMVYAQSSLHYWRNLVYFLGLKEGLLEQASMGEIMSRTVEVSGNDARPLVKVYTRARLKQLFRCFADISIVQRQLVAAELPRPLVPLRPLIERVAGWNLILKATKPG